MSQVKLTKPNAIDRLVGYFSPRRGIERMLARATMSQMQALGGGGGKGGYSAGDYNRFTQNATTARVADNQINPGKLNRITAGAWELYRDNPHARKVVRSILSKVIGQGPKPLSQAARPDGKPHEEFRRAARKLWESVCRSIDYRGLPGFGGQSFDGLCRTALRTTILSGDCFYRMRPVSTADMLLGGLAAPVRLQLIEPARIDQGSERDAVGDNVLFRGIELNGDGVRVAYHVLDAHPGERFRRQTSTRIEAGKIGHLYASDDIDQLRGTSWFAPLLTEMRDTGDYQYNELKAAALAACVVLGIRRPKGTTGLLAGPADWDLTDEDGNRITAMQPGMILDLGTDGAIEGFSPNRPSTNAAEFVQHMLRSIAAGAPGVKGSTVTGDYRRSSFASERSADNDIWPELEEVQQWFFSDFCQPIYESVIKAAVTAGYFDSVIRADEFLVRKAELLACKWQGPIARSINPVDDIAAAVDAVAGGISSIQIECAKRGLDWREVLAQIDEFREYGKSLGLPEKLIDKFLGLEPQDVDPVADSPTVGDTDDDDEDDAVLSATGEAAHD